MSEHCFQSFHGAGDVLLEPLMVAQEVRPAVREDFQQFRVHVVDVLRDGIFDVVPLPVEGGVDVDVPLLV